MTGSGISASLTGGTATVTGGSLVPFQNTAIAYMAQKIAVDELAHVTFIRTVLGSAAVPEPNIDLVNSFNTLAIAAGLIVAGQTFNPFESETNFLLGAYVFEDVGVTAYGGAAALLSTTVLPYAASILAVEGYHAGGIRTRLSEIGGTAATNLNLGTAPEVGDRAGQRMQLPEQSGELHERRQQWTELPPHAFAGAQHRLRWRHVERLVLPERHERRHHHDGRVTRRKDGLHPRVQPVDT